MNYYCLDSSLSISPSINALKWRFHLFHNPKLHHHTVSPSISCSFPRRRPRPRRRLKHDFNVNHSEPSSAASESRLHVVIDIDDLSDRASLSLRRFLASSEIKFNRFLLSGDEAFRDLRTMITSVGDRKVVISCRPSTLEFFGYLVLWGFVVVFAFRNLVTLGLRLWNRVRVGHGGGVIRRRDRSLGGREVVVARKEKKMDDSEVLTNPLSSVSGTLAGARETMPKSWARQEEYRLPSWWPVSLSPPVALLNKEEHQREANRLIRGWFMFSSLQI